MNLQLIGANFSLFLPRLNNFLPRFPKIAQQDLHSTDERSVKIMRHRASIFIVLRSFNG